jgi:hypothetical protein
MVQQERKRERELSGRETSYHTIQQSTYSVELCGVRLSQWIQIDVIEGVQIIRTKGPQRRHCPSFIYSTTVIALVARATSCCCWHQMIEGVAC